MNTQQRYQMAKKIADRIEENPRVYRLALRTSLAALEMAQEVIQNLLSGKPHRLSGDLKWNGKIATLSDPLVHLSLASPTQDAVLRMSVLLQQVAVLVVGLSGKKTPPPDVIDLLE